MSPLRETIGARPRRGNARYQHSPALSELVMHDDLFEEARIIGIQPVDRGGLFCPDRLPSVAPVNLRRRAPQDTSPTSASGKISVVRTSSSISSRSFSAFTDASFEAIVSILSCDFRPTAYHPRMSMIRPKIAPKASLSA